MGLRWKTHAQLVKYDGKLVAEIEENFKVISFSFALLNFICLQTHERVFLTFDTHVDIL